MSALLARVAGVYDFAKRVAQDYSRDNASLVAAAVSFYAFLSLIPLIVLVVSITAFFLGSAEHGQNAVMRLVSQYYPVASGRDAAALRAIVDEVVRGKVAVTGLSAALLLWSGLTLMNSLCRAMNVAWDVEVRRGLLAQRLIDLVLLLATIALLGVSLGMTAFIELVKGLNIRVFGLSGGDFPLLWNLISYLVPLVVTTAAFTMVYKVAPNMVVPMRVALLGGAFSGIMWELAKVGFGYYVSYFVTSASLYGSLGGVVLLLAWINYSSIVTVLGAEVGSVWQMGRDRGIHKGQQ